MVGVDETARRLAVGRLARLLAGLAALSSLGVLFRWLAAAGPNAGPEAPTSMKANTAIAALVLAAGVLCAIERRAQAAQRAAAWLGLAIALATALQYALGLDLGFDQVIASDPSRATHPGRMSVTAAVALTGLGVALLTIDSAPRLCSAAAWSVVVLMIVPLLGHLYGAGSPFSFAPYTTVAFITTLVLLGIALALVAARPDRGLFGIATSDTTTGRMTRALAPALIATPLGLGWVSARAQASGIFGIEMTVALLASVNVALLTGLLAFVASSMFRAERERLAAEGAFAVKERELRERFRLAIDAAPTGMLMMDRAGKIVLANAQVEKMFGYERGELFGSSVELLVPRRHADRHPDHREQFFLAPRMRLMGAGRPLYGVRKDGVEVPVEIGLNPLRIDGQELVLSSVVDVTERKQAEAEREALLKQLQKLNGELEGRVAARTEALSASLREREVLLQEVHHRVKNNLQIIGSLINMQMRQLRDAGGRDALAECKSRVEAIALIHEKLYQSRDYARVPFSEYARHLASNVFHVMAKSSSTIDLELEMESVAIPVDKAIPCGLILNELISNALKHAYPSDRAGKLCVRLWCAATDRVAFEVADDGVGLPASFDPGKTTSLGMQLVATLVEQLGGELAIEQRSGTVFRVDFPLEAGA